MTVARVLPNVTGLDKTFDYLVPPGIDGPVVLGAIVRVELHGRRVGGWIVEIDPPDAHDPARLKPLAKVTGLGPPADVLALTEWAALRWAGRRREFLQAGSPPRAVRAMPPPNRTARVVEPRSPASTRLLEAGGGVLRLPPSSDPMPAVLSAAAVGPTLVVVPAPDEAVYLGSRLRRAGFTVAVLPNDWAAAAGGVDVVVGGRAAAFGPVPDLAAAVLLDEHDEALYSEASPTWNARDALIERCRTAGVPLLMVSPCPTVIALAGREPVRPPRQREREGWPVVEVVDRTDDEPWKRSQVTSALIRHLRDHERTVVCVTNVTGRARLLACRQCRELARCERCDAAVVQPDDTRLDCPRCGATRPLVCLACGAGRFANLRPGVSRLREELEAAANRPAVEVTAAGPDEPPPAGVYVGTEAALHRVRRADTVAFLDFDSQLLAPRFGASEQAMALLVRAARLVGRRDRGGRILIQTFLPTHDVVRAALHADPGLMVPGELARREVLGLPPFGAIAEISGKGADELVGGMIGASDIAVGGAAGQYVLKAADPLVLGAAINELERPPGSRLRIAVDPY